MGTEEEDKEQTDIYEGMVTEAPPRKVDIGDEEDYKSLEEREDDAPNLSDLQTTIKKLFPALGSKIDQAIMVARVAPDMFIPLMRILVNAAIKRQDPYHPLNVAETASLYYVLTSIGLDGKGRIDTIELAGSAKEADDLESLMKGMG